MKTPLSVRHAHPAMDAHPELPIAGPRRYPHWLNRDRVRVYAGGILLTELLFIGIYLARMVLQQRAALVPLSQDFSAIWSAAWLAAHGRAADVWHFNALFAVQQLAVPGMNLDDGALLWLYPPSMLLLVLPLGWLPYTLAVVLWLGVTYALFTVVVHSTVQRGTAWLCALAFPAAFVTIIVGQTSLFTAMLGGLGLLLLNRRPVWAGICFGMLMMKPQMAILFPLALLCAGQWRALAAWAATIATCVALATLAFGPDSWIAFAHGVHGVYQVVSTGHAKLARMPTVFALAAMAGWPTYIASSLQLLSATIAAIAVVYAWRGACSYALRAATLACACLLVSPYLYDYDLTWYGIVIAWYARYAWTHGWRRFDREWLMLLWLMPLAGLAVVPHLSFQFMPLVTLASLGLLVGRIDRERRDVPSMPDARDHSTETAFTHQASTHHRPAYGLRRTGRPTIGAHR
ncbi:membrane protein [Burkholderia lata]|uniref:glycosyltransferase family 87 protein n=1 Tax=Burkholderia lata (strain ATCC 17760 / DSM 23089 / LMG 22485 / NCIMB 9086 / R18194 / 383) TaxID=482957 RepID=UPI001454864B|nr:glycosyltransferase family 87 protein [Burkholderia lata]VWC33290.1 membrane protein [Burkholderia lata]